MNHMTQVGRYFMQNFKVKSRKFSGLLGEPLDPIPMYEKNVSHEKNLPRLSDHKV